MRSFVPTVLLCLLSTAAVGQLTDDQQYYLNLQQAWETCRNHATSLSGQSFKPSFEACSDVLTEWKANAEAIVAAQMAAAPPPDTSPPTMTPDDQADLDVINNIKPVIQDRRVVHGGGVRQR
jgi:hypothetical protein